MPYIPLNIKLTGKNLALDQCYQNEMRMRFSLTYHKHCAPRPCAIHRYSKLNYQEAEIIDETPRKFLVLSFEGMKTTQSKFDLIFEK